MLLFAVLERGGDMLVMHRLSVRKALGILMAFRTDHPWKHLASDSAAGVVDERDDPCPTAHNVNGSRP